jgi:hypothetical protein
MHREEELISYFSEGVSVVYCKEVSGLISWFNVYFVLLRRCISDILQGSQWTDQLV